MRASLLTVMLALGALSPITADSARAGEGPSAAARCSCRRGAGLDEWRAAASTIVVARVVADSSAALDFHGTGDRYAGRVVRALVEARWKGGAADTLVLHTGQGGGDCGFPFVVGETYLVFARGSSDQLWTGICWPTVLAVSAPADLRRGLGRPVWAREPASPARWW